MEITGFSMRLLFVTLVLAWLALLAFLGSLIIQLRKTKAFNRTLQSTIHDLKYDAGRKTIIFLENKLNKLKKQLEDAEAFVVRKQLRDWLQELASAEYSNEIEVEVKFIYPFLRFLGYRNYEMRLRETVTAFFGRQLFTGVVDWTVRSWGSKPILVIEAKSPSVSLDRSVEEQARSYAFVLGAPLYMTTNGRELRIVKRGVEKDKLLIDIPISHLRSQWDAVFRILGSGHVGKT